MTNCWLKGVAIVALMAVGTVIAQAADLPTRKEAPAPVFGRLRLPGPGSISV